MKECRIIRKIKRLNPQKLFGCVGNRFNWLLPALSEIKVGINRNKRAKPKKNSGNDHALQFLAAKFCGHKSAYKMNMKKTPKVLKRRGVRFLEKSAHYDNVGNVDFESVWSANAKLVEKILPKEVTAVLDFTANQLEGNYDAKRDGYIGKNKHGEAEIGECHQIATVTFPSLKLIPYALRLPGNYNPFVKPVEYDDTKLSGLNFDKTVAEHVVEEMHKLYPNRTFFWVYDSGFDARDFWKVVKGFEDSFLTRIDKNSECTKAIERLIAIGSIVLKKGKGFEYHESLLEDAGLKLNGVYIKPENEKMEAYWLVTNRTDLSGAEMKKEYDLRSAGEPLHDYFKEDFNGKKPCSKKFAGAQAHTALTSLAFNIISMLTVEILGAYYRLRTLIAELLEFFLIEKIFNLQPTSPLDDPPPKNRTAIRLEKIPEKGSANTVQTVLSIRVFGKKLPKPQKPSSKTDNPLQLSLANLISENEEYAAKP